MDKYLGSLLKLEIGLARKLMYGSQVLIGLWSIIETDAYFEETLRYDAFFWDTLYYKRIAAVAHCAVSKTRKK